MIGDERFRVEQKAKMIGLDLDALFFDRQSPREQDYVAAFRFLFSQHDALISEGSTTPLRVPELCAQGAYARACWGCSTMAICVVRRAIVACVLLSSGTG
jgi:hypothetical protein